jgi:hypothetical protein
VKWIVVGMVVVGVWGLCVGMSVRGDVEWGLQQGLQAWGMQGLVVLPVAITPCSAAQQLCHCKRQLQCWSCLFSNLSY